MRPHPPMSVDEGVTLSGEPPSPLAARLRGASSGIGLLTAVVGVLVLLSWLLDVDYRLPMRPFTALCFVAIGVALCLEVRPSAFAHRSLVVTTCATAVVAISGLMLLEH